MSLRATLMSDYINQEFNRILSNPQNEIISESLKQKLKPISSPFKIYLKGENLNYECQLESFTLGSSLSSLKTISLSFDSSDLKTILLEKDLNLSCEEIKIFNVKKEQISKVNCFKFEEDTYIMEFSLEECLND